MEYLNFDIRILSNNPYLVIAERYQAGEAEGTLELTIDSPEVCNALTRLEKRQTDQACLTEFGKFLFNKLFANQVGAQFHEAIGFSHARKNQGVRIRLHISTEGPGAIPWELLFRPNHSFLATDLTSPLIRWLPVDQPIPKLQTALPLRVLVVIPRVDTPFPPVDAAQEVAAIQKALRAMKKEVELSILEECVCLDRIEESITEQPCQVIHFIGHGQFLEGEGALLLNNRQGGMEWVSENRLAGVLKNHPDLKLIVMNACQGATVAAARGFTGIAPRLVKAGIPAVVAMQYPIYDEMAVLFAEKFYFALFSGPNAGRVDCAMVHARSALFREMPDEREFAAPVLYLRAPEGVLFYKYSGRRLRDAAFSRASVQTEKAIEKTYVFNQSFPSDSSSAEYEYLKRRIAFSKRVVMASMATSLLVFLFFLMGVLDLLRLDTLMEGFTLAVGITFVEQSRTEDVAVVVTDDVSAVPWRKKFAQLVDQLSRAGAKVVVFDVTFEPRNDRDTVSATRAFARAITDAQMRGTEVILGFRRLYEGKPDIDDKLWQVLGGRGVGAICLSRKLGFVTIVPLLIIKDIPGSKEQITYPSLALAAFFAARGITGHRVKFDEKRIILEPVATGTGFLGFSEKRGAIGSGCGAIQMGDSTADLFIDMTPAKLIENALPTVTDTKAMSEEFDTTDPEFFSGKVVFVGEKSENETFRVFDLNRGTRLGVELHADAYRTIVRSNIGEPVFRPLGFGYQALMITVMTFLGGFIRFWVKPSPFRWRLVLIILVPLVYGGAVFWVCVSHRLIIDWLYHVTGFFFAYLLTGRVEKRWL
jgi:CHASE2 domain-containing sensor protein